MNITNLMDCIKAMQALNIQRPEDCEQLRELFKLQDAVAQPEQATAPLWTAPEHRSDEYADEHAQELDVKDENEQENIERNCDKNEYKVEQDAHSLPVTMDIIEQSEAVAPSFELTSEGFVDLSPASQPNSPELQPLFQPGFIRQNLLNIGAVYANKGPLDEKQLLQNIVKIKPLLKIPRRQKPVVPSRVQLLIDLSVAMDPFTLDIEQLTAGLAEVLGRHTIETLYFHHCPQRGVGRSGLRLRTYDKYFLPQMGTKVICISDMGRGKLPFTGIPADIGKWLQFSDVLLNRGCSLVILTPYVTQRLPAMQSKKLHQVYWDRSTRPSTIFKQL